MWATIGSIVLKYWVEFFLGAIVAGGGFLVKRFLKLEREDRKREQDEYFQALTNNLSMDNSKVLKSLQAEHETIEQHSLERYSEITENVQKAMLLARDESKDDDKFLQDQISALAKDLSGIKAGMLSMQGKEFRANCRKLLAEDHEITLDEWEEIDADHEAYNSLGGNHRGDQLYSLVKKKAERFLTD